jgi:hypothetical protein
MGMCCEVNVQQQTQHEQPIHDHKNKHQQEAAILAARLWKQQHPDIIRGNLEEFPTLWMSTGSSKTIHMVFIGQTAADWKGAEWSFYRARIESTFRFTCGD